MTRRPAGLAGRFASGLVLVTLAAGCSSAGPAPGRPGGATTPAPSSTAAPATRATSSTPSVVDSPGVTPSATATAVPTTAAPSSDGVGPPSASATAPAPRSTCTSLTIRIIRGSAAPGYEFAALQFVNTGNGRCVLNGYPSVTLLRGGNQIGDSSVPAGSAPSSFTLDPGATAESRLKDYSSCQAPLSDTIRVVAPGSTITLARPGELRACRLTVSALAAPE